ncbi:MAG: hypothetical protein V1846_04725 [Candidatus Komeilibacteria bacterium]
MIRVLRWIIAAIPLVFFALVVLYDLNLSGVRVITYDWQQESPQISRLYPVGRLTASAGGLDVLAEPVYWRVRYPQKYDKVTVAIRYQQPQPSVVQLGLQVQDTAGWNYYLQTLQADSSGRASVTFDPASAAVEQRSLRFMLSLSNYDQSVNKLTIEALTVSLYKQPLTSVSAVWRALQQELYALVKSA